MAGAAISAERHRSQVAVYLEDPLDRPRCRDRALADVKLLFCRAKVCQYRPEAEFLYRAFTPRGLHEKIVRDRFAAGGLGDHESTAPQRCQHRFRSAGGEVGRQDGIERVPPRA